MRCPLFLLHGGKDELVPASHSREIFSAYEQTSDLVISKDMGHSLVYLGEDFLQPFMKFLQKVNLNNKTTSPERSSFRAFELPALLYKQNPNPVRFLGPSPK